jgi:hypothetical protein
MSSDLIPQDEITADYGLGYLHELARQRVYASARDEFRNELERQVEGSYAALATELRELRAIRDRAQQLAATAAKAVDRSSLRWVLGTA